MLVLSWKIHAQATTKKNTQGISEIQNMYILYLEHDPTSTEKI